MDQDYDNVRLKKNSYDRKLAILQEKIKNYRVFKSRKQRKSRNEIPLSNIDNIASSDHRLANSEQSAGGSTTTLSFKKQNFVKLFVEKLKQNSFNSINNNKINLDRINELTQKIDTVILYTHPKGPKGWKAPNIIKILITIMTLFAIVCTQFLSTFQCLFQDYRNQSSDSKQITVLKDIMLAIAIFRILTKIVFVKIVLGQKIQHISSICYCYVTNFQFYMDIVMLISIVLIILYPQSIAAGGFGCCGLVLNIIYFQQMNKQIDIFVVNNNIKKQILALFRLLLANLFMSHLVAMILIAVTIFQSETTWMQKYGINEEVWWSKYTYSLYYSATIVSTVGFGDFSISSRVQALIVTFVMLFGCIVLSYNITKVSTIVQSLNQIPDRVRNQLSVLDRLAAVVQLDENLHHTIGQYIIHVGEIKRTFELNERHQLIQTLPSQLKQQFIEQSSKNFCSKLPFFFMLQLQTKKRICELIKMQVMSPNEYITHKKLGLKKIIILRKGIVGLTYRKKGSNLNGRIVDTIQIKSETERPQLLNTYLLIRGKRLLYDIVCQKYCIVGLLQFEQFIQSLKESEIDYELYHQTYDEANFRTNQWYRNKCNFCYFKHSIFVCPKMHYAPLRSIVFMRHQKGVGNNQVRAKFRYQREKIWYSKCSPLKFWRKLFVPFEKVFDTNVQKSQILRIKNANLKQEIDNQSSKWREFEQLLLTKQFFDSISLNIDAIQNFRYYFYKDNANNLIQRAIVKKSKECTVQIQRIDEASSFMHHQ